MFKRVTVSLPEEYVTVVKSEGDSLSALLQKCIEQKYFVKARVVRIYGVNTKGWKPGHLVTLTKKEWAQLPGWKDVKVLQDEKSTYHLKIQRENRGRNAP